MYAHIHIHTHTHTHTYTHTHTGGRIIVLLVAEGGLEEDAGVWCESDVARP
jgi:hypothetical protein